jgi:hypothetical protein
MMPDPRLKEAMRAINRILRTYDIAGAITLVSKTHAEFRYQFPTWSVVQPERGPEGQEGLRIRSFEAYYGSKEQQKTAMEESLHCLYQIRDLAGQTFLVFENLTRQVEEQSGFDIEHHPYSGFEPHEEPDDD